MIYIGQDTKKTLTHIVLMIQIIYHRICGQIRCFRAHLNTYPTDRTSYRGVKKSKKCMKEWSDPKILLVVCNTHRCDIHPHMDSWVRNSSGC